MAALVAAVGRGRVADGVLLAGSAALGVQHLVGAGDALVGVTLGTLDTPLGVVPQKHIYTESKAGWYIIADGLPQEPGS